MKKSCNCRNTIMIAEVQSNNVGRWKFFFFGSHSSLKKIWEILNIFQVMAQCARQGTVVHPDGWSFSFLFLLPIEQQETLLNISLSSSFCQKMAPQIFVGIFPLRLGGPALPGYENVAQRARKFKKVQVKKFVKSNKSKTIFLKLHFWQF